jgi:hypothetical protein
MTEPVSLKAKVKAACKEAHIVFSDEILARVQTHFADKVTPELINQLHTEWWEEQKGPKKPTPLKSPTSKPEAPSPTSHA